MKGFRPYFNAAKQGLRSGANYAWNATKRGINEFSSGIAYGYGRGQGAMQPVSLPEINSNTILFKSGQIIGAAKAGVESFLSKQIPKFVEWVGNGIARVGKYVYRITRKGGAYAWRLLHDKALPAIQKTYTEKIKPAVQSGLKKVTPYVKKGMGKAKQVYTGYRKAQRNFNEKVARAWTTKPSGYTITGKEMSAKQSTRASNRYEKKVQARATRLGVLEDAATIYALGRISASIVGSALDKE